MENNFLQQLPLDLRSKRVYRSMDYYVTKSNKLAYDFIERYPNWNFPGLWITGDSGAGKTHLVKILSHKKHILYYDQKDFENFSMPFDAQFQKCSLILDGLTLRTLEQEEKLFHVFNYIRTSGQFLILTTQPHVVSALQLPDLISRLKTLYFIHLNVPEDDLIQAILIKVLSDEQIPFSQKMLEYYLKHAPRNFKFLQYFLDSVRTQTLVDKRKPTLRDVRALITTLQK